MQTVPLSGGALIDSSSLAANINSSYPFATGWHADADKINLNSSWPAGTKFWYVYMNNASSASNTFTMFRVCAKLNVTATHYMLATGSPVVNLAGHDTNTSVFCPGGLSIISGGVVSGAGGGLSTDLNTTFPFTGGWGADENNGGPNNPALTAYALCAS